MSRWSDRGFGFIRPQEGGEELFCHLGSLLDGEGSVLVGDIVTYTTSWNDRRGKFECKRVRGTGEIRDVATYGQGGTGEKNTGVMTRWMSDRGFGFIEPKEGGEHLFVHVRSLPDGVGSVYEGDIVTYICSYSVRKGKWEATDVRSTGERAEGWDDWEDEGDANEGEHGKDNLEGQMGRLGLKDH
eukprot:gnl/TRDRNA2_/TRDRNA2_172333_c0_seq9.p1 gnl/TRDRNA2_/TRDRNA2_172333_c0~~gnl/TRDRNA2_/TRDRNA2_172333_c0_seq9.p1  ORF type:complete len:185 (+),score=22.75 gnl/TRDRNA2_/TRDRNA2_172333_c0_seq9:410-964(+)